MLNRALLCCARRPRKKVVDLRAGVVLTSTFQSCLEQAIEEAKEEAKEEATVVTNAPGTSRYGPGLPFLC